jgi:hypothetical protein
MNGWLIALERERADPSSPPEVEMYAVWIGNRGEAFAALRDRVMLPDERLKVFSEVPPAVLRGLNVREGEVRLVTARKARRAR